MVVVTWTVVLLCVSTVFSGNYDGHAKGSYFDDPREGCIYKEVTQEKQDKIYNGGLEDFRAQLWSFDSSKKNGPDSWCNRYPACGGKQQSPIHIQTKHVKCDDRLTDFYYRGYDSVPKLGLSVFHLDWQAVTFELTEADISIRSDWLGSDYTLYFIFLSTGLVHQIDDKIAPIQIGLSHWNSRKYSTQREAEKNADGVVILNVLVDVAKDESKLDKQVVDAIDNILAGAGNTTYFPNFPLIRLLPSCRIYYEYQGSYPFPSCDESVARVIFKEPIYISKHQYEALDKALSGSKKKTKCINRPMQPLNGRIVYSIC